MGQPCFIKYLNSLIRLAFGCPLKDIAVYLIFKNSLFRSNSGLNIL